MDFKLTIDVSKANLCKIQGCNDELLLYFTLYSLNLTLRLQAGFIPAARGYQESFSSIDSTTTTLDTWIVHWEGPPCFINKYETVIEKRDRGEQKVCSGFASF